MKTITLEGHTWDHDPATEGYHFAYYTCECCHEIYPMLVEYPFDILVGGVNTNGFTRHGPGCRNQRWLRVSDSVQWPQPPSVLEPLRDQWRDYIGRYPLPGS